MTETARTLLLAAAACACVAGAWALRPAPSRIEAFDDAGERFHSPFAVPADLAAVEITGWDDAAGVARPLRLVRSGGPDATWRIASHHDLPLGPAGEARLARTAAALVDLERDAVRSDRRVDHAELGVVDPLDVEALGLDGRGTRVILRGAAGETLVDLVVGDDVPQRRGMRFVREPAGKRTYQVRIDADLDPAPGAWIEQDLLDGVRAEDFVRLAVSDYAIDEAGGRVAVAGSIVLDRTDAEAGSADGPRLGPPTPPAAAWSAAGLPPDRTLDADAAEALVRAIARLRIAGVRPKPPGLVRALAARMNLELDAAARRDLESRGFFLAPDGRLLANEGELTVAARDGRVWTIRFGEAVTGTERTPDEARFVLVTCDFDPSILGPRPGDLPGDERSPAAIEAAARAWDEAVRAGRRRADEAQARLARWYHAIPAADFDAAAPRVDRLLAERGG